MRKPKQSLKISDVSRLSGVPVSTLRVWGERGLLAPEISPNGYRLYDESHVRQALDIKRLRTLQGLSIAAVKATLRADSATEFTSSPPPAPAASAEDAVGARLRSLRRARNLTIREVAAETGLSPSALASIERTSLGVKIPEARALAAFYGLTLTALMSGPASGLDREILNTAQSGRVLPTLGQGLRIEQLATGQDMMDCQRWFIEPGVESHGSYSHDGEEFVYVLLGEIVITIEESRVHHLRQGESVYFRSSWKHAWRNPGKTVCVLLWVNTPPSF